MNMVTITDSTGDVASVSVWRDHVWLACESAPFAVKLRLTPAQARALIAALETAALEVEGAG